jgi:hypothetical protein
MKDSIRKEAQKRDANANAPAPAKDAKKDGTK